jgi:hypothetical protein
MATDAQILNAAQPGGLTNSDWEGLLYAIKFKGCTPFLGAGACAGVLPLGRNIAEAWAAEYEYPFEDRWNLIRVAQYVAVKVGPKIPKFKILESFQDKVVPNFSNPSEPHRTVAELDLPVYITTNYDDFMMQAIKYVDARRTLADPKFNPREPRQGLCKWHLAHQRNPPSMDLDFDPSDEKPIVFHLHGYLNDVDSMVLTEDDYLDFLMNISETQDLIPPRIQRAFGGSSFIFLGYSLEDMNFKVLFRKLAPYMRGSVGTRHVSVQISPREGQPIQEQIDRANRQRAYLERHFDLQSVKVYWGTCEQFSAELQRRRRDFNRGR